jgi:flagellar assembly protein FliH
MTKQSRYEVEEYSFQSFQVSEMNGSEIRSFSFQSLDKNVLPKANQEKTLKLERQYAKESGFKINPIVLEHRGLSRQQDEELEARIQEEVEKRIAEAREAAVHEGLEEGRAIGREEVHRHFQAECEEKVAVLSEMIAEVLHNKDEILKRQKREIYELVKNLTKWVTLKELKEDGKYLERLLEKLIQESQTKSNLLVHVGRDSFSAMPEVLDIVQKNLGILTNVRVEIDPSIKNTGLILESENGIINASLEEQFNAIDKLFKDSDLSNEKSEA